MNVEQVIYIYEIVCIAMILFNSVCNLILILKEPRVKFKISRMMRDVRLQINLIRSGKGVSEKHMRFLRRKMRRPKNLTAFDTVLETLRHSGLYSAKNFDDYIFSIYPVFISLAVRYQHSDDELAAFYARFLSDNAPKRNYPIDSLQDVLLEYIEKDNFYCHVNVLLALCSFGNQNHIIKALTMLDNSKFYIHNKIITGCLFAFEGDRELFMRLLWENYVSFSNSCKVATINYLCEFSDKYTDEMLAIADDAAN